VTNYEKRALPRNRWPLDQDQYLQMKSGEPALLTVPQRIKEYTHIVPHLFEYDERVIYLSHRVESRQSGSSVDAQTSAEEATHIGLRARWILAHKDKRPLGGMGPDI